MDKPTERRGPGIGGWLLIGALVSLLGLAVYFSVAGWDAAGDETTRISAAGIAAMILGVVVTLALGIGLMALVFLGERRR